MKVQELKVRHVRGVRNIKIYADDDCNELVGKRGAGKSTLLDAIRFAIGGPSAVDSSMLRQGETKGEVSLKTDDGWEIVRTVREGKKPTAKITKDGQKRLQGDLDKLFTDFAFDPLAFSRMRIPDQVECIKRLAGKELVAELDELDKLIKEVKAEITLKGREIKGKGTVDIPAKPDESKRIDTSAVMAELKEIKAFNQEQEGIAADVNRVTNEVYNSSEHLKVMEGEVAAAKAALARAEKELEESVKRHASLEKSLHDMEKPQDEKDISELDEKLAMASEVNDAITAQVTEYKAAKKKAQELDELKDARSDLQDELETLLEKRSDKSRSIKMPVEGMTFSDDGIRVDGKPFKDLSSSEKISASAEIGMAIHGDFQVMLVQDGALLGEDGFAELVELAKKNGIQLWVETIGKKGFSEDAIYIEAGELKTA
jgi:DNA repair exonuclease SbcCD ATPase subunit